MSTDAPTIADLHRLGIARGFPAAEIHDILHEAAEMQFGAASMTALGDRQRRELASWIRAHNGRPSRGFQPARSPEPRDLSRAGSAGSAGATRAGRVTRPRGRPVRDGVTKMITPRQREFILTLASELGWSASLLNRCLKTHWGRDSLDQVGNAAEAMQVIRMLKGYKMSQSRSRRLRAERKRVEN